MDVSWFSKNYDVESIWLTLLFESILRPAFFMENFNGTIGKITAAVLRSGLQPTTQLQLIVSHSKPSLIY